MDFNFESLGSRQFEHLSQALVGHFVGPRLSAFGEGSDGGREASWDGPAPSMRMGIDWDGYGVLQAKHHQYPGTVAQNLSWLSAQISDELARWAKKDSPRARIPEYILFTTNVRLSAGNGGGKEAILAFIASKLELLELPVRDFGVWDYDDLRIRLDDARSVRDSYFAWITPGDLLSSLYERFAKAEVDYAEILQSHAARSLREDNLLNLRQAGTVESQPIGIADVFIDLPMLPGWTRFSSAEPDPEDQAGITKFLIQQADALPADRGADSKAAANGTRVVLIGGPGQGKSTVTQFLAQVYRAAFIEGSAVAQDPETSPRVAALHGRLEALELKPPVARRWPIRIILSELADYLTNASSSGLLDYIAQLVSVRSSAVVTGLEMRKWLGEFPWLLLIDGLDEVPNSSNRDDVLNSLSDFYLEVAASGADVTTVATTRPQGYSNEFNPQLYQHVELAPLSIPTALSYARNLISIRAGVESAATERTLSRLTKASEEESTARLFSSPLQVTILTILIEKLGRVPRDRWRLFSEYYRVISQRELEKGGELADLLQSYATDVDFIHRYVGDALQRRSAEAGETTAFLNREEFREVIVARLTDQEHDPEDVEALADDFLRLATDRLVFLAFLNAERVGFEIRSLQEFMAGEFLVNRPEAEIVPRLTEIAKAPHWRNTILFAIGCIFADREHLRAEVTNLCADLNTNRPSGSFELPGSELALDILLDGACHSQPKYARPLAGLTALLLDGVPMERPSAFASLRDGDVGRILNEAILVSAPTSATAQINRALVLDALASAGDAEAPSAFRRLLSSASGAGLVGLARLSWRSSSRMLAEALAEVGGFLNPADLLNHRVPTIAQVDRDDPDAEANDWVSALRELNTNDSAFKVDLSGSAPSFLTMNVRPLRSSQTAWRLLAEVPFETESWELLKAASIFALAPSRDTLATALDLAARSSRQEQDLLALGSWPLAACLEDAEEFSLDFVDVLDARSDRLRDLSQAAKQGELGDLADWLSSEEKWREIAVGVMKPAHGPIVATREVAREAPIWASMGVDALPLLGSGYLMANSHNRESIEAMFRVVSEMLAFCDGEKSGPQFRFTFYIAMFIAAGIAESVESETARNRTGEVLELPQAAVLNMVNTLLEGSKQLPPSDDYYWVQWLGLVAPHERDAALPLADLAQLGTRRRLIMRDASSLRAWIAGQRENTDSGWQLTRLGAHGDLKSLTSLSEEAFSIIERASDTDPMARRLYLLLRVATAAAAMSSSDLTDLIRELCGSEDEYDPVDTLQAKALRDLLLAIEPAVANPVAMAAVSLFMSTQPFLAISFQDVARRTARTR